MSEDVKTVSARKAQSQADKIKNKLLGKKPRTKDLVLSLDGEEITLTFQGLGAAEMDALRAKHKPTTKQRADGYGVNIETYNPALVAATLVEPKLSLEEVAEIFASENWTGGEVAHIFNVASEVCLAGFDLPSKASA